MARQTVNELLPAIGAVVAVRFEQIEVACQVIDAKSAWGKERILIMPLNGGGTQWVELGRVNRAPAYDPTKTFAPYRIPA